MEKEKNRENLTTALLEYFEENEEVFNTVIEELDNWNSYLGDNRFYPMEMLPEFMDGRDVFDLLNQAYFGNDLDGGKDEHGHYPSFNPNRDYFRFDGYGNLESTDYVDYSDRLDEYFIAELLENAARLYLPFGITEIIAEYEDEEQGEE